MTALAPLLPSNSQFESQIRPEDRPQPIVRSCHCPRLCPIQAFDLVQAPSQPPTPGSVHLLQPLYLSWIALPLFELQSLSKQSSGRDMISNWMRVGWEKKVDLHGRSMIIRHTESLHLINLSIIAPQLCQLSVSSVKVGRLWLSDIASKHLKQIISGTHGPYFGKEVGRKGQWYL